MITKEDLYILSYYRASELAGALLFGKLAMITEIDDIRIPMTRHCAEEAEHAWLWTKAIKDLGEIPIKVTKTYQTHYGAAIGIPKNMLEIFCLTQILEKRVVKHFSMHLTMPKLNPVVKKVLIKMVDDEKYHLDWVKEKLDEYSEADKKTLEKTMKKFIEVDKQTYKELSLREPFKTYFKGYYEE
ncbi:MAG: hypothetical protein AABX51_06395 [Nanoarchaeota archaeon]